MPAQFRVVFFLISMALFVNSALSQSLDDYAIYDRQLDKIRALTEEKKDNYWALVKLVQKTQILIMIIKAELKNNESKIAADKHILSRIKKIKKDPAFIEKYQNVADEHDILLKQIVLGNILLAKARSTASNVLHFEVMISPNNFFTRVQPTWNLSSFLTLGVFFQQWKIDELWNRSLILLFYFKG